MRETHFAYCVQGIVISFPECGLGPGGGEGRGLRGAPTDTPSPRDADSGRDANLVTIPSFWALVAQAAHELFPGPPGAQNQLPASELCTRSSTGWCGAV